MTIQTLQLPIFPLPVFLLPGGITRLRIFEAKYLKMIPMAIKGQGFVICFNELSNNLSSINNNKQWGSWVEVINFHQGLDGILEVDVKCQSLVNIHAITEDKNQLYRGDVSCFEHWANTSLNASTDGLSTSLVDVFESSPLLEELYSDIPKNNAHWVVARWLELLPLEQIEKNEFVDKYNFFQAKKFIHDIIFKS